jgi:predicted NACHT family NTPase
MTGFEPLAAAAIAGLTGIITEVIKSRGGKLLNELDRDILKPNLKAALQQYVQNYQKRHGELKVACVRMDNPMKLDELYTAVQLLDRSELRYFESADALQDGFRASNRRGFGYRDETKRPGIDVANQAQYLMVLGGPGVGKSTFLRKIGLEALKSKQGTFQHDCIPVFLALQQFRSKEVTVTQLIAKEFEIAGFPEPEEFAQGALDKGKLLILLDGLDEVPTDHLDHAINQIQDLVDRYSQNRFIASCRIAAYKGGFTRFSDVAMAPFDDEQIEQFIRNWFRSIKDQEAQTADQCWQLLQQPEYQAARELAQTPLLLTLLCAVYDKSLSFPKNRAALYGKALDVLLEEWAAEKRIKPEPIYQEFTIELERELLADIAYEGFESDQLFFNKREVTSRIKAFLVNNLNAPKHLDSEKVLEAIEVQQGILVERARNAYSFSHLTFQEYLTAQYIVDNQQIEQIVSAHLTDERWREVFLLIAGLVPGRRGADDLLLLMEKQAQTYINTHKLHALLQWAEEATEDAKGNYNPAAKQAVAIYLALDLNNDLDNDRVRARHPDDEETILVALTRALACALALTLVRDHNFDNDLALALNPRLVLNLDFKRAIEYAVERALVRAQAVEVARIKIFKANSFKDLIAKLEALKFHVSDNNKPNEGQRRAFAEKVSSLWFEALHLNPEIAKLTEDEVHTLSNYLYVNELMVRCKEAAVRVSPEVWAEIEERMVTGRMRNEG